MEEAPNEQDRQLLQEAAKAAGLTLGSWNHSHEGFWVPAEKIYWDPLSDDGDALRLAVKLRMDIAHFKESVRANVDGGGDCHELNDADSYAATRRAIVRAAAVLVQEPRHA